MKRSAASGKQTKSGKEPIIGIEEKLKGLRSQIAQTGPPPKTARGIGISPLINLVTAKVTPVIQLHSYQERHFSTYSTFCS
jgi:hypothetical protein